MSATLSISYDLKHGFCVARTFSYRTSQVVGVGGGESLSWKLNLEL